MWKSLNNANGRYFLKQDIESDLVVTLLTDMVSLWEEALSKSEAISRFKSCNPSLQTTDEKILEFITWPCNDTSQLQLEKKGDDVTLFATILKSPNMDYRFDLVKKSEDTVFKEVTLPLLLLVNDLKNQKEALCKELEAKDVELLEYKLDGYKITRKNVITPKFEKEEFEKKSKEDLENRCKSGILSLEKVFLEDVNNFYPLYKKAILPLPIEILKGEKKLAEEKVIVIKPAEPVKSPPKKKYAVENNVPIKRAKLKKRIV